MNEKETVIRKHPCPKCDVGELYDCGGMFIQQVRCDNPDCDYEWDDYYDMSS